MRNPLAMTEKLESASSLDRFASPLSSAIKALPLGPVRDLLHGGWQQHALHPTLVQVPVGTWSSAALLDLRGGEDRAARLLVAVGLAGAAPAALSGAVDYADQFPEHQRVGLVHAAANLTAVALCTASLVARRRPGRGRLLGFAGLTVATVGGFLGGHLAYRQGAGVNHSDAVPHLLAGLGLVRDETEPGELHALAGRCAHLDGPLSEGEIHDGRVTCPWHGSTFRLRDGARVAGPATCDQPAFEVRLNDGLVEVRLPAATAAP